MAKPIVTASLVSPAFLGLNTQESSVANDPRFALKANNCVIDRFGRLGARKGWQYVTTSGGTGTNLEGIHPFLEIDGTNTIVSWNATTFYKGTGTLSTITPTTTDTITEGNWQAVTLNDRAYFFQRDYKPLYYTNESTADEFKTIDQHADYDGTAPEANIVMSAFGRLFAADTVSNKTTVYFSDLLNGAKWGSGSAGSLNIAGVLPKGSDVITGLAEHNGRLIIFCKNNIIIYADQDSFQASFDVNTLRLVEVISGVGCIGRDTIQNIGDDVLFLSSTGLRSLGRTIQEKSQPLSDISKNIRDVFLDVVNAESSPENIKSVYNPDNAFYLLHFPTSNLEYIFDTRGSLEDASLRATTWTGLTHENYTYDPTSKTLYLAQTDGIAKYYGFKDNGSSYNLEYYTNHFDLSLANKIKILKRVACTVIGSSKQTFSIKVGFEYTSNYFTFPFTTKDIPVSEYGISEYGSNGLRNPADATSGVSEYTGGISLDRIDSSVQGAGDIIQIGVEAEINGAQLSVQKLDLYGKEGRIL
jgi:hypothetical protein